ncbi:hypothetical protein HLG76_10750, partial [Salinivibrio sp. EAGSL]|nr:hypothetical protein [Salinivibrio sp. EAGSL]
MSSQKELGIQLPPLLPLEYCTVERATRLLGCEVEDIYHWNEIGAVKLYAYFQKRVPGKIEISMLNIRGKEEQHPREYLKEVAEKTSDQYKKVRDSILSLNEENTLIAKVFEYYLVGDRVLSDNYGGRSSDNYLGRL